MKTALFKPLWEPFALLPVTENSGVSVQTALAIRAVIMLDPGETQLSLRASDIPEITSVLVDGVEASYTISGTTLTFDEPNRQGGVEQTAIVEIERAAVVDYTIFIGQCVPGIRIDEEGRLRGLVGNVSSLSPRDYTFGIRANWDGLTADVVKMWTAYPVNNQLAWNFSTLPDATQNSALIHNGRSFYTLGEVKRGQYVEAGIDIINPDGTPIEFLQRASSDMADEETVFSGLPHDIVMTNNPLLFKGLVTSQATPGDYFVELYTDEPLAPPPIIVHFRVLPTSYAQNVSITRLHWDSESYLGQIKEASPSSLSISATADGPVTYSIAPGSRSLPTGLTLTSTGEIRGLGPNIAADQTITFTAKAVSGSLFSEKEFSFDLVNVLTRRNYMTVKLPLSGPIRRAWQTYTTQIPAELRYRSGDPLFPVASPNVTLVRGLTSRSIPDLEYDEQFWTILGAFKVAQVMDLDGNPLYDVIYREFVDPMARAGGFAQGDTAVEVAEYYPQDRSIKLADASIRNLRYDLVSKVGLNAEVAKEKTLGVNGGEILDPWMTSTQKNGTVLGYVPAGIIAYVLPNTGHNLIATLNYGSLPNGQVVHFDRLHVEDGSTRYFYYLGVDNNSSVIVPGDVLPPTNLRVNGIAVANLRGAQIAPIINWEAQQEYALYTVRIYSASGTLLREITDIDSTTFDYSDTLWIADGRPSVINIEITSVLEGRSSSALRGSIALRAGWDYAWGYVYGGEPLGNGRRDGVMTATINVVPAITSLHQQPPHGDIILPIIVEANLDGVLSPAGTISTLVTVAASATNRILGTVNAAINVVPSLSNNRFGSVAAPILVTPAMAGTYARPAARTGVLSVTIPVGSSVNGSVEFLDGTGAISAAIQVASAMSGTAFVGTDNISAAVVVTPFLAGNHRLGPATISAAINIAATLSGNFTPPQVSGAVANPITLGAHFVSSRGNGGPISAAISVQHALAGGTVGPLSGTVSAAVQVTPAIVGHLDVAGPIDVPINVGAASSGSVANFSGTILSPVTVQATGAGYHIERVTGAAGVPVVVGCALSGDTPPAGSMTTDITVEGILSGDTSLAGSMTADIAVEGILSGDAPPAGSMTADIAVEGTAAGIV
jgi:hypothetical protein